MAIVVVGGQTRNIGKTGVVAGIITALPERRWTAIKITPHPHDIELVDEACAITEEHNPNTDTDSSRFLAAGAERSFLVRIQPDQLAEAMPRIRRLLAEAENVIIESNSILGFLRPDVFLVVLDPSVADFKASAMQYLDRVDAFILPTDAPQSPIWSGISQRLIESKPRFLSKPPAYCSSELLSYLQKKFRKPKDRQSEAERRAL